MATQAKSWKPQQSHSVTPYITVDNAAAAIDYYKRVFRAEEISRMANPDGKVMHAEIRIGDSILMISDEFPQGDTRSPKTLGGTAVSLYVYFPDVDATFNAAVQAGGQAIMSPTDMFWGDRWALVKDPFGHSWGLATHKEDVTPDEMGRRAAEFAKTMGG
ncbi:MAG TPA: VOC family protein [Bryobacteraceae bacterium]|nr:VOC family protein [Bryobacteraceae bacterium]